MSGGAYVPALAVLSAVPLAAGMSVVYARFGQSPEKAVLAIGAVLGVLLAASAAALALRYRSDRSHTPVAMLAAVSIALAAIYLFVVKSAVFLPADILIWSENDFVNDILKFRVGYPIYTPDVNNESFFYSFGTPLLTYGITSAFGHAASVPAFRVVQVLFTFAAAWLAALSCRRIVNAVLPGLRHPRLWLALWGAVLFLIATNQITNPYTYALHNDALAQLITSIAFYLLLRYTETRSVRLLAAMAVLPALGFLSKQSVLVWAGLCGLYLLLDRPFSLRRVIAYAAGAAAAFAVVIGICFAIWGRPFFYWTFTVLGAHEVSPLRSFQHVLDAWPYFAAGLFGGWMLLRSNAPRRLLAAWAISMILLSLETYTSGVAWMLNHIGPGCLLAGVWFMAGLTVLWQRFEPAEIAQPALATAIVLLAFAGLGLIRIPLPLVPDDAYRYLRAIEKEFQGFPHDRVLLDAGTWMYLKDGVVMKDRAPTVGERGYSQTGDFSGIVARIGARHYDKILVRNYHNGDFWYDHESWRKPSGVRAALAGNYTETGTIPEVAGNASRGWYLFNRISVLTPKTAAAATGATQ